MKPCESKKQDIFTIIEDYLIDECGYSSSNINLSSNLKKDITLDSLDFTNIICALEDEYVITIEEDVVAKWETIGDIVESVYLLINKQ